MSFSQNVKKEIFNNVKKIKGCCATSFLTAVMRTIGSLCVDFSGYGFSVETDNGDLLLFCDKLCRTELGVDCAIYQISTSSSEKSAKYIGKFDVALGDKLKLTHNDADGTVHLSENVFVNLKKTCCRRAFVQALFLCCGSCTIPEDTGDAFAESAHSNYHLELRFSNANFAQFVLEQFPELCFRQTSRKNNTVLYLKDSEKISDFFGFTDAVNAKFTVENVIIGRSFRNTANRQRNCIDSNIDKAIIAGSKHLEAIAKIRAHGMFNTLPQQLQDVAVARENTPEANLAEIAATLGISKSGANHRLARLLQIAEDLD